MNRICALLFFLFICIPNVKADEFRPFDGPRPLAVMIETNPWLMVIGSDTPSFVLYEDGQVIFREKSEKRQTRYLWKQLAQDELASLKVKLTSFGPFRKGHQRIDVAAVSDQPETKLFLNVDKTELVASIYGLNFVDESQEEGRSKVPLPAELRELHAFLSSFEFKGATEWTPKYVEVIAWDYSHAVDASISWPKQWPGLNSPTTIKKKSRYSIFMPGAQSKNLSAFLRTAKARGAVEIDGKKCAVAVRPAFPSEPVWRNVLFE